MSGIEVSTDIQINHWELGTMFAEWDSVEQANFLHGMATGFSAIGGLGPAFQLNDVVSQTALLGGTYLNDVQRFTAMLNDYFTVDE